MEVDGMAPGKASVLHKQGVVHYQPLPTVSDPYYLTLSL